MPSLTGDILLLVLVHLDANDVLNFRMTCKEFYQLSKSRVVWNSIFHKTILGEDLPVPGLGGRSLNSLTSLELEYFYHKSITLRRNWHSEYPANKRSLRLPGIADTRIIRLYVLSGPGDRRCLVSLALSFGTQKKFTIRCWDLRPMIPVCIAERDFNRMGGMAVNKSPSDVGCIAVLTSQGIEILTLDMNAQSLSRGFITLKTIPASMDSVHHFQDRRLIATDHKGRLYLLHIDFPRIKIEFQYSTVFPKDFILTDTFLLVLKSETLELYPLPLSTEATRTHVIVPPIFAFQWPWQVDRGVMTLRHRLSVSRARQANDPITIFVRFGSVFPWSVNILHQYEIRPNPYFIPSELPSEMNVPYKYPPVLTGSIGSPVRLNATTDLAVGAYGTAVWVDSHTEKYYKHAERGQRVAGTFAKLTKRNVSPDDSEEDDEENSEEEVGTTPSDQGAATAASFIYAHKEEDSWLNLAIDEEEGVIFLGRTDGAIDVFEYAP